MKNQKAWLVFGVIAALLMVWLLFLRVDRLTTPAAPLEQPLPAELEAIRSKAFDLQQNGEWCPAQEKWQELSDKLRDDPKRDDPKYVTAAGEASANLAIAKRRCSPGTVMVGEGEPVNVDSTPQPTITEQSLLSHYPPGKTIRSVALLDATGRGSNQKWIFRSDAYFAYESRFAVESNVLTNTGSMAEFEVSIPVVTQDLAVSDKTIQLEPPVSPIAIVVWEWMDRGLRTNPYYRTARHLADLVIVADPNLERTLTAFYRRLKIAGHDLDPNSEETQLKARIDALSGHRLRLVYVPGYGVQTIEILDGEHLPKDDLLELARNSGLLMDYVLSDVLSTKVGQTFDVNVQDVVRMIGLNYDVDVSGTITLKRGADEGGLAIMSVVGGEVVVEAQVEGVRRKGTLTPKSGDVKFNQQSLFVTQAKLEWRANLDWFTEDHPLFGTRAIRDLDMRSYYEAEMVKGSKKSKE